MNIAVQLFTFEPTRRALLLLNALGIFLKGHNNAKLVWVEHDGNRRAVAIERVLSGGDRLNEAYVQTPQRQLDEDLVGLGLREVIVHLSVSPSCEIWAPSAAPAPSGKPSIRKVLSYVQSLERASAFRKFDIMPTVLEVTFRFANNEDRSLMEEVCNRVEQAWSMIECEEKFATVDFGGEWLFFPKSGYNPNVSKIHVFYGTHVRTGWKQWRERHNASFSSGEGETSKPVKLVHIVRQQWPELSRD